MGVNTFFIKMTKLNFIKSEQRKLQWKQIEIREDSLYFRWKQRLYRDEFVCPQLRLKR